MTDDQLAKELHELKRRREMPLPPIEMFDALLSLAPVRSGVLAFQPFQCRGHDLVGSLYAGL